MNLQTYKLITFTLLTVLLFGCASDGDEQTPRLDLSPQILVEESNIGQDHIIQLSIKNLIKTNATSAYGFENNLKELFTELITEAFERQEFDVIVAEDRDPEDEVTEIEVTINTINNQIQPATLTSNIVANAAVSITAINQASVLTLEFSSTRTKEVALNPTLQEVTDLTELAIAQVIKRLSIDEKILKLATRK